MFMRPQIRVMRHFMKTDAFFQEERRESPRHDASVLVRGPGGAYEETSGTLGITGCFFWSGKAYESGEVLELRLLLPEIEKAVFVQARVLRSFSSSGARRPSNCSVISIMAGPI